GILKTEFGLYQTFQSYSKAVGPVCKAIEKYNNVRPHMSCEMMTPDKRHNQEFSQYQKNSVRAYLYDENLM
ncbi:integrase core domain-containing protein, partial [Pedobacter psychroterrae]